jgi:hypothetical protein
LFTYLLRMGIRPALFWLAAMGEGKAAHKLQRYGDSLGG